MSDVITEIGRPLRTLDRAEWLSQVEDLVRPNGHALRLDKRHMAVMRGAGPTLLVAFETLQGIQTLSARAHPLGWSLTDTRNWSCLTLISDGDTWFRSSAVFSYFDHLVDEGFFDRYDRVIFYGANACGYAAAAFSVTAPGARVIAIQPQATLASHLTEWDKRFPHQRRIDFTDRYGYAPRMIEAATQAYIIYDPFQAEDAMHATLFDGPNVTKLRLRNMGSALQTDLLQMGVMYDLLKHGARDRLSGVHFAKLMRARRDHLPYLRRLLSRLDKDERDGLALMLCHNVSARMRAPRFASRLQDFPTQPV